ncbi:Alcohol dehydrogenase GroES domain-containing protein [Pleurostoma richardsiae]|uniref:Alcohol dehydrogenase GroES domain-containing protein n=1 Tax=Pleurostoma richardsiae TaxID=41990 RepID=A0AA38R974_9PEZI|nr:Alcohol dehydrogenase GroES domain-containing protein [Pleurostoma richardsiae]
MASHAALNLPATYRALSFTSASLPGTIITKPTPLPTAGTAIIRPLACNVVHYAADIYSGGNPRGYRYPLPLVPGGPCVARVAAAPSDAPHLRPGTHAGSTPESWALMEDEWRDGTWAELARVPAENVHLLDEARLLGSREGGASGLGYALEDLAALYTLAVPYGGLRDVGVAAGETVLVAPATGVFSGAAVHVALAMGARVVAMGRNEDALRELEALDPARVATVRMSGSAEADEENIRAAAGGRPIDVFFDISPRSAGAFPHARAGILCLRYGGRASLMGGVMGDLEIPYGQVVHKGLRIQGTFMYTPQQADELIRMVETGVLRIGEGRGMKCVGRFDLEQWAQAFKTASRDGAKMGRFVILQPNKE